MSSLLTVVITGEHQLHYTLLHIADVFYSFAAQ